MKDTGVLSDLHIVAQARRVHVASRSNLHVRAHGGPAGKARAKRNLGKTIRTLIVYVIEKILQCVDWHPAFSFDTGVASATTNS